MNVTVTNHKGGCGKSTTAVHVAAYLAREFGEGSVVLVDTDPNGSALEWAARGGGLPFRVVGPQEEADEEHAVFDSQGRLHGEDLAAAAMMSDVLVVPTTGLPLDQRLGPVFGGSRGGRRGTHKVLLTMVPWYERLHCPGRVELEGAGVPLFERQIQERKAFRHAANEGLPVYGVRRRGRAVGRSTRLWAGSCSERWRWRDERGGDRRNRGEGAMAGALARRSVRAPRPRRVPCRASSGPLGRFRAAEAPEGAGREEQGPSVQAGVGLRAGIDPRPGHG